MEPSTAISLPQGIALPALAPLSAPLIAQVVHQHLASRSVISAVQHYPLSLTWLLRAIEPLRAEVYAALASAGQRDTLSASSFLALLHTASSPTARPNVQLLSNWRGRGILQAARHGYLEPQRAAAVLIARRLVPHATRNWLPDEIAPREPIWWCWRQDGPTAPITTCPVPLPPNLPSATLLWVPWAGATWLPDWSPIATGALYCGHIQSAQALAKAAQLWQLGFGAGVGTNDELSNDATGVQEVWTRLISPLVLTRFTPIMASTE